MLRVELIGNIYFDTNILVKLPLTAPSTDFSNLKDLCDEFNSKMFISDLTLKEYINYHIREVSTKLSNIKHSLNIINDRITSKIKFNFPDEGLLFKETEEIMKSKISGLDIITFDRKVISYDKLEEIALKEITPWRDKGNKKSIRDSLILLSVLEHAKDSSEFINIFITEDNDFIKKDFSTIIKSYNIKLKIVNSLIEAENIVKESLSGAKKALYELEENELKSFLETQKSEILEFVRKQKYNTFTLAMGDFGQLTMSGTIEKINAIDYVSIHSARPSSEKIDKNGKRVTISFMTKLKFNVSVRNYEYLANLGTQIGLEGIEEETSPLAQALAKRLLTDYYEDVSPISPVKEQSLLRNISIEASVFVKNANGNYEYADLELERVIT